MVLGLDEFLWQEIKCDKSLGSFYHRYALLWLILSCRVKDSYYEDESFDYSWPISSSYIYLFLVKPFSILILSTNYFYLFIYPMGFWLLDIINTYHEHCHIHCSPTHLPSIYLLSNIADCDGDSSKAYHWQYHVGFPVLFFRVHNLLTCTYKVHQKRKS